MLKILLNAQFNDYSYIVFQTDPSKWSIDDVCQWLELIGLGAFRQAFRGTYIHILVILF